VLMEMRDSNGKIRDSGTSTVSTKGAPARPAAVVVRDTESGVPNRTTNRDTDVTGAPRMTMTTRADLINLEFYKKAGWAEEAAEVLFKIKARQTTIRSECYYGLVHFISCVFCLAVIPQQLSNAGYDARSTVVATAATCGLGCIICGLFANLPFVLAPPAVIGIFLTNNLQTNNLSPAIGSSAVVISGVVLTTLGYRPLAQLVSKLIPLPIQVGTAVGVGLLTAFAGATDVRLVVKGTNNHLLGLGDITPQVMIAVCGIIIITVSTYYRMKGAFRRSSLPLPLPLSPHRLSDPSSLLPPPSSTRRVLHRAHLLLLGLVDQQWHLAQRASRRALHPATARFRQWRQAGRADQNGLSHC